jgi:molecular chaperone DnaJ
LAEFDAESSTRTQPEASGFIARMKEFFENLGNV